MRFLPLLLLAFLALPAQAAERLPVVATFSVLGDMVQAIGGAEVEVTTLVGPDGDVHAFEPSPREARKLGGAKLLVVNGLGLEGWLDRLRQSVQFKGKVAVASTGVTPLMAEGERDPHAWQDARNGTRYVDNILSGLIAADPAREAAWRAGADAYRAAILAADARIRAALAAVPEGKRRVITTHDAFGYYGAAYGVAFLSPLGVSSAAEPSAKGLAALERQIRSEGIRALFLENVVNPRLIGRIAKDTGAVLGPPLYSDALSPAKGPAATYLGMLDYNTRTLVEGMQRN